METSVICLETSVIRMETSVIQMETSVIQMKTSVIRMKTSVIQMKNVPETKSQYPDKHKTTACAVTMDEIIEKLKDKVILNQIFTFYDK